mmetsp:Transcript_12660/g.25810  ORF Transcript_12660/g.25810 Transcript_12660/m.25810 type:complete len:108 (+) Transcript_12660:80-403(+)
MVHQIVKRWRNGTKRVEHKCEMCDTTSTNHVSILPKRIVRYKSLYRGPHPIPRSVRELFVCCADGILYYNLPPRKKDKLGATNKTAVAVWSSSSSSVPRSSPCCHGT